MAEGSASLGKIGLTTNVGKRESARQDLQVMGQLFQMKKQQEQEEQQAALIEQQYYDQIRKEADEMLSGDRKRINERSKALQGQIRQQIKAFGGSRAKFMASGGLAMIGDYTRGVLDSPEVATYKDNKKNLETILDVQKKGMGHLLSARDTLALQEYNKLGTGNITYSGLKSQIDMPPSESILFGQYATGSEILFYDQNYLKILGNYKVDHPDSDIETWSEDAQRGELLSYTLAEGWAQRGTKVLPQQGYGRDGRRTGTDTDTNKTSKALNSISGNLRVSFDPRLNKGVTLEDMKKPALSNDFDKYLAGYFGGTPYRGTGEIDETIGRKILDIATNFSTAGLWDLDSNNTFRPRSASDLGKPMTSALFVTQNGEGYDVLNNEIQNFDIENASNLHYANGQPIEDKTDFKTGNYKLKGSFMGYEFIAQDNKNYLVVDAVDEDGKPNDKRNERLYSTDEGAKAPEGRRAMYIALEAPDGRTIYQKVDYGGFIQERVLQKALGEINDISEQFTEAEANKNLLDQAGNQATISQLGGATLDVPNDIFNNNSDFRNMVGVYNHWSEGSRMRENLMKGFYMATLDFATLGGNPDPSANLDDFIKSNKFGTLMYSLGLDNRLDDMNLTDMDLLDLMQQRILSDTHSKNNEEKSRNYLYIEKIRNYMIKTRQGGNPTKAMHGANFGFTPGSEWEIAKNIKGPSHSGGGVDVNLNKL